jgi:hypothetical protein
MQMSKKVVGDPKEDVKAKKAFKVIDDTFYASNQFKASNLRNYDIEILKKMADISRDFALAAKYITVRLEQSDGAQKAQINSLEKRLSILEIPGDKEVKTILKKLVKTSPVKKPAKKKPAKAEVPQTVGTISTNSTATSNV